MKKGRTYTIGNYRYKVTNANTSGKGTVTVTGIMLFFKLIDVHFFKLIDGSFSSILQMSQYN